MRVLIAEDQDYIRMGLKKIIGELDGLEIVDVSNGALAWESFCMHPADIVVSDIVMPDMDGLDLLMKIRAVSPECILLVISGHDKFDFAQRAIQIGVKEYLLKPVRREPLLECIERYCAAYSAQSTYRREQVLLAWQAVLQGREEEALNIARSALRAQRSAQLLAVYLRNGYQDEQWHPDAPLLFPLCTINPQIRLYIAHDAQSCHIANLPSSSTFYMESIETEPGAAFVRLARRVVQVEAHGQILQQVVRFIDEHYAESLTLGMLAGIVYLHPNYLSSHFKLKMGCGFAKYLQQVRIGKAKPLLIKTNQKIYEISALCGFNDEQYFTKVFKNLCNETPQEYRNRH